MTEEMYNLAYNVLHQSASTSVKSTYHTNTNIVL